jgi:serine/threonine-protein kinase HipA
VFKPRVKGVVDGELIEYVVMRAASALGIPAAAVDLFIEGDQHSLVVARFDRRVEAGGTIRIHQEDLLQSLGLPRLRKFESLGGPGIEQVMRLLARSSDGQSRARYAVQLMFAWIVLSTDAHAKNSSLFLQPDGALLTPMYDASSVIPYLGPDRDTDHGSILRRAEDCSLAVKYGASYSARDVARFELDVIARAAGMPGDDLLALVANCLIDISHTVSDVASALPVGLQTDTVARLVEWMPLRAKQAARALDIGDLI